MSNERCTIVGFNIGRPFDHSLFAPDLTPIYGSCHSRKSINSALISHEKETQARREGREGRSSSSTTAGTSLGHRRTIAGASSDHLRSLAGPPPEFRRITISRPDVLLKARHSGLSDLHQQTTVFLTPVSYRLRSFQPSSPTAVWDLQDTTNDNHLSNLFVMRVALFVYVLFLHVFITLSMGAFTGFFASDVRESRLPHFRGSWNLPYLPFSLLRCALLEYPRSYPRHSVLPYMIVRVQNLLLSTTASATEFGVRYRVKKRKKEGLLTAAVSSHSSLKFPL
ncbi:hypothetical protein KFK09_012868 [Dendrobium nobile]|uniref:Uncharacterized protein n=1 Tax=Dendrobium nobile TaxID=94219 RepID=A0A8T3BIX7_DENNO|nr:hypothetical protein KFK09_012868 [Dendrobium nobile]